MASPLIGTVVPFDPQFDGSPEGYRQPPAGATELADAAVSAGDAVASIAPLALVEGGGMSSIAGVVTGPR